MAAALALAVAGVFFMALSLVYVITYGASLTRLAPLAIGALLLVVGLVLLVTSLVETWLSRGQSALVDGLQAG